MAQGIFLIECGALKFLQASLFHKGNQNEDEVSFFVIVDDSNFQEYVNFRNEFERWLLNRDRNNLEIQVIGGESVPYSRDISWDELFLPDDTKKDIRTCIEGFLSAKNIYAKARIPWKRGLLFWGEPGNGKTTLIKTIIANYPFKPVTVQIGSGPCDELLEEAFAYAGEQEPGLIYLEDITELLTHSVNISHFLQLMDGVEAKTGILVIGTANDISTLHSNITDRPSRFDRKWEIPLPDKTMAVKYLKHWFKDIFDEEMYLKIAAQVVKKKFSYSYLKDLYLSSVFIAISNSREEPTTKDVDMALNQLLFDKKLAKENFQPKHKSTLKMSNYSDDESDSDDDE